MSDFNFLDLVGQYAKHMLLTEETGGEYDYTNGGKWMATTSTREVFAAAFNVSTRDIRGYGLTYDEGGAYTTHDIKIYVHEQISLGATIIHKDNPYTVSAEVDHSTHANGLRIYVARRAGKVQNAQK